MAGWVVRTPKVGVGGQGERKERDLRDAHSPGVLEGEEKGSEREQRGDQATQESMMSLPKTPQWGQGTWALYNRVMSRVIRTQC